MMKRTLTNIAVLGALGLLAPLHAQAFGLGKLQSSSALNEPFKAEIAVTALKADEAVNLQVRLASAREFEQAGIERSFLLTKLKFDVVEKAGGAKIVISSEQPIREPFLDFLLTATTTRSGRLIREYTVLLDPPVNVFKQPAAKQVAQTPKKTTSKKATNSNYQYPASTVSTTSSRTPVSSYTTKRNDTLWDVALATRPDRQISVHQMMMALLNANPTAFHRGNVNGLKAGYNLTVPTAEEINQLSNQQAIEAISKQNKLWKNRNARSSADNATDEVTSPPSAGNTAVTDSAQATDTDDSARLKLLAPSDKSAANNDDLSPMGSEKIQELSEQLTLAQETIEVQAQENIDFKSRLDDMQEDMEVMRRLISLKDADLARLQGMSQKAEGAEDVISDSVEDLSLPTLDETPETIVPEEATEISSVDKWEAVVGTGSNEENISDLTNTEKTIETAVTPQLDNTVVIDEMESDTTVQTDIVDANSAIVAESNSDPLFSKMKSFIVQHSLEMAIGAGSLLLLLIGMLVMKRRKETEGSWEADTSFEESSFSNTTDVDESIQTVPSLGEEQAAYAELHEEVSTLASAELLEQAEMLIAYTDFDQAKTLLEQAKEQDPENQAVLSKLLFVMFKQQQVEPFVALASDIDIDKDSNEWSEIAGWGRELAPLNDLFKLAGSEVDTDTPADLELDSSPANLVIEPEVTSDDTIEFNLDDFSIEDPISVDTLDASADNEDNNADTSLAFDYELSLDDDEQNLSSDEPLNLDIESEINDEVLSLSDEDTEGLSFDEPLTLDITEATDELDIIELPDEVALSSDNSQAEIESSLEEAVPTPDLDLSLDLDSANQNDELGFNLNDFDGIDEAETKLELASAYADMGDPEGARSILEEVLKDGTDEQKSKAQELLSSLS